MLWNTYNEKKYLPLEERALFVRARGLSSLLATGPSTTVLADGDENWEADDVLLDTYDCGEVSMGYTKSVSGRLYNYRIKRNLEACVQIVIDYST